MVLSRHAGFFASLERVEDRLALEKEEDEEQQQQSEEEESAAASPLVLLDDPAAGDSSGPALEFLTLTRTRHEEDERAQQETDEEEDDEDIEQLMALLGLPPPPRDRGGGGCECSGGDGFLAKVVGVVGPKCDGEKRRLDAWIHHFHHRSEEPARLAHLLLAAKFPSVFPTTVKEFLDRDAPSAD